MYKPEGPFRTNPIIFKMFAKSETMLLVTLLQISFKLYTLYNLLVPLGPISFKMYTLYNLLVPLGPISFKMYKLYNLQPVVGVENWCVCVLCVVCTVFN